MYALTKKTVRNVHSRIHTRVQKHMHKKEPPLDLKFTVIRFVDIGLLWTDDDVTLELRLLAAMTRYLLL